MIYQRLGSVLGEVVSLELLVGRYPRPGVLRGGSCEGREGEPAVGTRCRRKSFRSVGPLSPREGTDVPVGWHCLHVPGGSQQGASHPGTCASLEGAAGSFCPCQLTPAHPCPLLPTPAHPSHVCPPLPISVHPYQPHPTPLHRRSFLPTAVLPLKKTLAVK